VFSLLHTANHAPGPRPVGHGKSNGLGAILRNAFIIMLFGRAKVGSWPDQGTIMPPVLDGHLKTHSRRVPVPLEAERRAHHHYSRHVSRKERMHVAEAREINTPPVSHRLRRFELTAG
jgi:hypothetical protein